MRQIYGLSLKHGVDIMAFAMKNVHLTSLPWNHLRSVQDRLWPLNATCWWSYAVSSSNIRGQPFTDVPWSTCDSIVHTKSKTKNGFFLRKHLTIIDGFDGLWLVWICFRRKGQFYVLDKRNRLCYPLSLLMAVSMIPNMWHLSSYCMRLLDLCPLWGGRAETQSIPLQVCRLC